MVALYVRKINEGTMVLDQVPPLWREKVRLELEAQNPIEQ